MTNISAEDLPASCQLMKKFAGALEALNIKDPMQPIYDIFKNVCADGACVETDQEYYLSFLGHKRDFMAPKEAVDFAAPPLREVFHFDVQDYGKIAKHIDGSGDLSSNKSVTITAESFLDSGLDIPKIWLYILARRSFVERSIDLEDFFGRGTNYQKQNASNKAFLRSGIYPCVLSDTQLSGKEYVDVKKGNHSSTYTLGAAPVDFVGTTGKCMEVLSVGRKIVDKRSKASPLYYGDDISSVAISNEPVSELSMILGYTTDNIFWPEERPDCDCDFAHFFNLSKKLTFNEALQNALHIINNNKDLGDNPSGDALFFMSQHAFLDRNQFGDYLNQYEILSVTQKAMDELNEQMQEVRESILFAVEDTDYTLREDFDLTNKTDYKNMGKILHEQKQVYWKAAQRDLEKIHAQTDNLQEKIEKAKHVLKVLQQDDQEIVAVSGEEDLDELKEIIKTKQANSAVADEYAAAESESKQNQQELMPPYCAVYYNM